MPLMFAVSARNGLTLHDIIIYILYYYIQVVPGKAGGGSFQKSKPIGNGHVEADSPSCDVL